MFKSEADPIDWLVKNLEVNRLGESEIVEVSLGPRRAGISSKDQATIINAVAGAYIDEVVNKERKQMLRRTRDAQETLKNLRGNAENEEGNDPPPGVNGFARPDNL